MQVPESLLAGLQSFFPTQLLVFYWEFVNARVSCRDRVEKELKPGLLQRWNSGCRVRMALPFASFFLCLFFFFFSFFPSIYCSCPFPSCGNIEICPPFCPNTTDHLSSTDIPFQHHLCTSKYMIQCENNSKPMIKFNDHEYVVKEILYPEKVLILQDQALGSYLHEGKCGFLYNFSDPIHNFDIPTRHPPLCFKNSSDCGRDIVAISSNFFPMRTDSHHCNDYNLYYWNEPSQQSSTPAPSSNCLAAEPTLFQWMLSFSQDDGPFSLLSAGFSHKFELWEDCFYCQVTGQRCASSNGTGDHSCLCENICKASKETDANEGKKIIIGSVVGVAFLLASLSLALYFCKHKKVSNSIIFWKKNLNNNQRNIEVFLDEYRSLAPKRYQYSDVKKITKSFREKLGHGGYGTVFKGTLSNGKVVAVKILNDSKGDGEEFTNEVASIGRTSHVNVVNLLGFCSEGSKRALIYEFMCNGSLEKLIYSEKPKTALDWEKLYQIALGTARGLQYLHRGCNTRIVHFDIKPHNVLLDQDFCPKISDFGLAKLCLKKDSLISIAGARGTIGYIAPEVFSRNFGIVSSKSDVYSYGMMVLEIAGGRKNVSVSGENSSETYFPHWIYEHLYQNGDLLAYGVAAESEETVRKMILVGLWCIQTMPQNRPSMSRVIEMLEGSVNDLQVPPEPCLSSSPFGSLIGSSSIQDICWLDSSSIVHS